MPTRKASAVWEGGMKSGRGTFSGSTGSIQGEYSVGSRFESAVGSNPEELLAAAHAACFSMAFSGGLERNGTPPERIETQAECTVEKVGDGWKITTMKLATRARVPGIDEPTLRRLADGAIKGCPVSQALKGNVRVELDVGEL